MYSIVQHPQVEQHSKGIRGGTVVIHGVPTHKALKGIALVPGLGVEVGLETLWWLFTEEKSQGKRQVN